LKPTAKKNSNTAKLSIKKKPEIKSQPVSTPPKEDKDSDDESSDEEFNVAN
jgi:hypothetical protein